MVRFWSGEKRRHGAGGGGGRRIAVGCAAFSGFWWVLLTARVCPLWALVIVVVSLCYGLPVLGAAVKYFERPFCRGRLGVGPLIYALGLLTTLCASYGCTVRADSREITRAH